MSTEETIEGLRAELELSRRLLADAQQLARIGSWEWDLASNVVTWSDELYRIYGYEPQSIEVSYEEFLGRVHPDDRASVDERNRTCFATHEPFEDVKRIVRPDGSEFLMRTRGEMVKAEDGTPIRMIGVCENVSDEVKAREASDRLVSMVEHSHDAIFTCTLDGTVTSWNPAAEELYRVAAGDIVGRSIEPLLAEGSLGPWLECIAEVAAGGTSVHHEVERRTVDGIPLQVSVALSPVRDHHDAVVAVADSARDVADRRRVELADMKRRRAMDLNDTVIQSLVLARYRFATDPEEARRSLSQAIAQCQRIVDELLDTATAGGAPVPGSLRRETPARVG